MLYTGRVCRWGRKGAFTLVEIMIVVAIIAILAAIAIPNYLKHGRKTQQKACLANLRTLEGVMELYRLGGSVEPFVMETLCNVDGYIKGEPRCPADRTEAYDISGLLPLCPNRLQFPDHTIVP